MDLASANSGELATNGRIGLFRIQIRETVTVGKILFWVTAIAVTPTSGQNWLGIYDSARNRVAQVSADGTVVTTQGLRTVSITPVSLPAGYYWIATLFNAATAPTIGRSNATMGGSGSALNAGLTTTTGRAINHGTAQTVLPASLTSGSMALGGSLFWAAVAA